MSAVRADRKSAIKSIVQSNDVRTQGELTMLLKEHGFEVTQATVSRDMADMRLEKDSSGVYVLPELSHLRTVVKAQVREARRAGNQVVIICGPGAAQGIAAAIDAAGPDGVLGSIAGDDTILVIAQDEEAGQRFQENVERLIGERKNAEKRRSKVDTRYVTI